MAEKLTENQFDRQGVNPFNAPIPGESLTTAPDMQKAWERPPQFTDPDDCMENVYLELTSDEALPELVNMINDGKYCVDILNQIKAAKAALVSVESKVLKKHVESCVKNSLKNSLNILILFYTKNLVN